MISVISPPCYRGGINFAMRRLPSVLLVAAALAFGCSREPEAESVVPASGGVVNLGDLRPGLVLVRVNGKPVTSDDYLRRIGLETAIFNYRSRSRPAEQVEAARAQFLESRARNVIPELVNQILVDEYLRRHDFSPSAEEDAAVVARTIESFGFKGDLAKFAAASKVPEDYLKEQILVPSRVESAREIFNGGGFSVSDQEIDDGLARMDRYHDFAVASNAVTWATASNVLSQVTNGLSFAEAAKRYSVFGADEAERWEVDEYGEISNEELRAWAFSAPVGSVGGPFDVPDGLAVVKIVDRTDGTLEASMASEGAASVTLARIGFYMLVPDPEPRTREHVRDALMNWKAQNAQKSLFKELHDTMKIEYPQGTNFVYDAKI